MKINACTTRRRPVVRVGTSPSRPKSIWHSTPGSPSATRTVAAARPNPHRSTANRCNVRYGTATPRRASLPSICHYRQPVASTQPRIRSSLGQQRLPRRAVPAGRTGRTAATTAPISSSVSCPRRPRGPARPPPPPRRSGGRSCDPPPPAQPTVRSPTAQPASRSTSRISITEPPGTPPDASRPDRPGAIGSGHRPPQRRHAGGPMTGNPGGPMTVARNRLRPVPCTVAGDRPPRTRSTGTRSRPVTVASPPVCAATTVAHGGAVIRPSARRHATPVLGVTRTVKSASSARAMRPEPATSAPCHPPRTEPPPTASSRPPRPTPPDSSSSPAEAHGPRPRTRTPDGPASCASAAPGSASRRSHPHPQLTLRHPHPPPPCAPPPRTAPTPR